MTVAGLVLAAGEGARFGGPKALATIDGERLVDRAARNVRDAGCSPVVVVQGAVDLGDVDGATTVTADDWREGMGASLRAGLAALPDDAEACVIMLVDTPWLTPEATRRVVGGWRGGAAIATYDGRRGHPVVLGRRIWPDVAALAVGDEGARAWMRTHASDIVEVDCTGIADPTDVDEPTAGVAFP